MDLQQDLIAAQVAMQGVGIGFVGSGPAEAEKNCSLKWFLGWPLNGNCKH